MTTIQIELPTRPRRPCAHAIGRLTRVMTMGIRASSHDNDDMPSEIDFSKGTRGKFHRPGLRLNLPVYLDDQLQATLANLAHAKGVELSALVNELLRKGIELIGREPDHGSAQPPPGESA
jgi:hypothetical protein